MRNIAMTCGPVVWGRSSATLSPSHPSDPLRYRDIATFATLRYCRRLCRSSTALNCVFVEFHRHPRALFVFGSRRCRACSKEHRGADLLASDTNLLMCPSVRSDGIPETCVRGSIAGGLTSHYHYMTGKQTKQTDIVQLLQDCERRLNVGHCPSPVISP